MSWQKCPICDGLGTLSSVKCSVCDGKKIISSSTGLPPIDIGNFRSSTYEKSFGNKGLNDDVRNDRVKLAKELRKYGKSYAQIAEIILRDKELKSTVFYWLNNQSKKPKIVNYIGTKNKVDLLTMRILKHGID